VLSFIQPRRTSVHSINNRRSSKVVGSAGQARAFPDALSLDFINSPELQKLTFNVDFKTEIQFIGKTPYVFSPLNACARKYVFLHVNGKLAKHLGVEFCKSEADVP
jgi:hypothetical protein